MFAFVLENLDSTQIKTLKAFWRSLIPTIDVDSSKVPDSPLGEELFYLFGLENPDCVLLRWLRARKWQVPAAVQHMMDTLRWRQEWGLRKLMANGENDLIPEECASGKIYSTGQDKKGRPVTYVHAREHIKAQYPLEGTEKLIILFMETSRHLVQYPHEDGTVVIDMHNCAYQNLDYQHIKFMINSMQNYYPECLGLGLVVNAPWAFSMVWSVIKPWLDPVVASKIHFAKHSADLAEHIGTPSLPRRLGGEQKDFEFIPISKEDQAQLEAIRKDTVGMEKARAKLRDAAQHYLTVTVKWAAEQTETGEDQTLNRTKATEQLKSAFRELIPYVSTRTNLHRSGAINEPMFDVVHNRIKAKDVEMTHM